MAAETDAPPRSSGKRENVFTRKIGPLPMWAWLAIVGTVIIGYAYWKNRQSSSTASQSSTTADASQVPQFVNQTYTTVQPPSAPASTPPPAATGNGQTPPPTTTTSTSGEASGPPGVSRINRAPKVKHQINQIHKEHQDYEADKKTPAKKTGTTVHRAPRSTAGRKKK